MEFVLKALEGIFSIVFIIGIGCVIASLYDRQYQ